MAARGMPCSHEAGCRCLPREGSLWALGPEPHLCSGCFSLGDASAAPFAYDLALPRGSLCWRLSITQGRRRIKLSQTCARATSHIKGACPTPHRTASLPPQLPSLMVLPGELQTFPGGGQGALTCVLPATASSPDNRYLPFSSLI